MSSTARTEEIITSEQVRNLDKVVLPAIAALDEFCMDDDVPNIQFYPFSIEMNLETIGNPVGYVDRKGYQNVYAVEVDFVAEIDSLLEQGQEFVNMLYTFRSVSKAIPEVVIEVPEGAGPEDEAEVIAKRNEINSKIVAILRPGMLQVKELIGYITSSISAFHRCVSFLAGVTSNDYNAADCLNNSLIRLLDLLVKLDNLKDMKASLLSDFARYKRAFGTKLSPENIEEITTLQSFLSNFDSRKAKNYIFNSLRDEVKRVRGHEDILIAMMEQSIRDIEAEMYLTADEKFRLIRVLPHILLLIDGNSEDSKSLNVFTYKKLKLNAIQKIFKKYPVTPLCGDMSMTMVFVLERSRHFDRVTMASAWTDTGASAEAKAAADHSLLTHWQEIRANYTSLSIRLAATLNRLKQYPFTKVVEDVNLEASSDAFDILLLGMKSISNWTNRVYSALAWKYTHPCSATHLASQSDTNASTNNGNNSNAGITGGEGMEYEQVIRYNFTKEELSVFVDIISMIKSLSSELIKAESDLSPLLRFYVHHRVQTLVQGDLVPLTHRVDKRNKSTQVYMLVQMRNLVADWINKEEPGEESYKNYRKNTGIAQVSHPARVVAPSNTQLSLLRLFVSSLCYEGASIRQKNGLMGKADLEKEDLKLLEQFNADSFYFPYILSYTETIKTISDLGDLWFKEFYLELTRCIQFPIEMSMPWILTEHIIAPHTKTDCAVSLVENVLYVLDIYNDAAQRALFVLNQQYLYDEIEAEANLVLDQLIFLLSDEIYSYYKDASSSAILDVSLKRKLEELKGSQHLTVARQRFDIPLAQRHANILGRTVDLNFLIGQHINNKFYRDIDLAIKKYESNDLCGLVEVDTAIALLRKTHESLSKHLSLDSFDSLLGEVDESFAPTTFKGRLFAHTVKSLVNDLFPNFSYNYYTQRFVKSPVPIRPVEYSKAPKTAALTVLYGATTFKAHEMTFRLTRSFFGRVHLEAFLSVIGYSNLAALIHESMNHLRLRMEDIAAYIEALREGIPPCKLPKYMFRAGGCYGFFGGKLRSILEYDDLKPEVFQNFREIGNIFAFLKDLSQFLDVTDQFQFLNAAPLLGVAADCLTTPEVPATPLGTVLLQLSKLATSQLSAQGASVPPPTKTELITAMTNNKSATSAVGDSSKPSFSPLSIASPVVISQLPVLAKKLIDSLSSSLTPRSLLSFVFAKVAEAMYHFNLFVDWGVGENNCDVVEVENAQGFHRLWSALNFLFCIQETPASDPSAGGEETAELIVSDDDEFGHGFAIAGCLFLHLLQQRTVFELMDFSYHVLNVHNHDTMGLGQSSQVGKVDDAFQQETDRFVAAASNQRQLHLELFGFFASMCPDSLVNAGAKKKFTIFHPPSDV